MKSILSTELSLARYSFKNRPVDAEVVQIASGCRPHERRQPGLHSGGCVGTGPRVPRA